jgi:hypothetical protein
MVSQSCRHCGRLSGKRFMNAAEIERGNKDRNGVLVIFRFL